MIFFITQILTINSCYRTKIQLKMEKRRKVRKKLKLKVLLLKYLLHEPNYGLINLQVTVADHPRKIKITLTSRVSYTNNRYK